MLMAMIALVSAGGKGRGNLNALKMNKNMCRMMI